MTSNALWKISKCRNWRCDQHASTDREIHQLHSGVALSYCHIVSRLRLKQSILILRFGKLDI